MMFLWKGLRWGLYLGALAALAGIAAAFAIAVRGLAERDRLVAVGAGKNAVVLPYLTPESGGLLLLLVASALATLVLYLYLGSRGLRVRVTAIKDITARKSAEEALRRSELRYRTIFEAAPASLWEEDISAVKVVLDALRSRGVTDLRDYLDAHPELVAQVARLIKVIDVNNATLVMYGAASKEELFGSMEKVFLPESFIALKEVLIAIFLGRRYFVAESVLGKLNGERMEVIIRFTIPDKEVETGSLIVSIIDITETKRTSEALLENRKRYQDLAELLPQTVFEADLKGNIIFVNHAAFTILGYGKKELDRGLNIIQMVVPEEQARARENVVRTLHGEKDAGTGIEYTMLKKDGSTIAALIYSAPLIRCGKIEGLRGIVVDITEIKQAKESLLQSEARFRGIIELAADTILQGDPVGNIIGANVSACSLTGYEHDELLRMNIALLFSEEEQQREPFRYDLLNEGEVVRSERLLTRKDGAAVPIEMNTKMMPDGTYQAFIRDMSERRRAEESRRLLEKAVMTSTMGIAFRGCDNINTFVNPAEARMHGYTPEEMVGMDSSMLGLAEARKPLDRDLMRGLKGWTRESINIRKDGSRFPVNLVSDLVLDENGEPLGLITICDDITERKRAEAALQESMAAAEAANRAKSEFLANMSHEIRTPLTAIIGFAQILPLAADQSERERYSEMIKLSGDVLMTTINDILDLAKIEAGKLELDTAAFCLRDVIAQSAAAHAVISRQKGVMFTEIVDTGIPPVLMGDSECLRKILSNLVSNAVKFTHEGEITLSVSHEAISGSQGSDAVLPAAARIRLHVAVKDTGIGIPVEVQSRIFDSFTQADGSTSRKYGGSGLGMTIVKKLAEMMGGRVWLESSPGIGTTFHVLLEFEPAEQGRDVGASPGQSIVSPALALLRGKERLHILLAEDNVFSQSVLVQSFADYGHGVTIAASGREAVELWSDGDFDLVLMDVQMPEMSGLEATTAIRRSEAKRGGHTPIIAMTADALKENRDSCLLAGMDDYVAKPVTVAALLARILGVVPVLPRGANGSSVASTLPAIERLDSLFLKEKLPVALRQGGTDLSEYVRLFLNDLERTLSLADRSLRDGNRALLAQAAHTLKGIAAYLTDESVGRLAQELERAASSASIAQAGETLGLLHLVCKRLTGSIYYLSGNNVKERRHGPSCNSGC